MASVITAIAALMTAIAAIVATPITAYINAKASIQAKEIEISRTALLKSIDECTDSYNQARNPLIHADMKDAAIMRFHISVCKMMAQAGIDDYWHDIDMLIFFLEEIDDANSSQSADKEFRKIISAAAKSITSDTKTRTKAKAK